MDEFEVAFHAYATDRTRAGQHIFFLSLQALHGDHAPQSVLPL